LSLSEELKSFELNPKKRLIIKSKENMKSKIRILKF